VTALTTWQFAPLVSVPLALTAALYLAGSRAVVRRHPARPWPRARALSFLAGLAAIVVATQGADAVYDDVSLRAHMIQHLLLIMVAPALLVYGRPVTLALHATRNPWHARVLRLVRSRAVAAVTSPPLAVVLYSLTVVATHLTPLILAKGWLHDGVHVAYLVTGYLFFLPVVGSEPVRWRLPVFGRYLLLVAAMPSDIVAGAALLLTGPPRGYAAADAHDAGLIMLAGGEGIMAVLALALAVQLALRPAPPRVRDEAGLDAYNDYLASLDSPPSAGSPPESRSLPESESPSL
jgi:putative copper resistance protein D